MWMTHGTGSTGALGCAFAVEASASPRRRACQRGTPAAGCGANSSSSNPSRKPNHASPNSDPAAEYAQCMRKHGVPSFPDPVDGHIQLQPGSSIDPSSPQFQAASKACQAWAPNSSPSGASATGVRSWPTFAAWLRQQATAGEFSGAVLVAKHGRSIVTPVAHAYHRAR
jgi:hypothetical protein